MPSSPTDPPPVPEEGEDDALPIEVPRKRMPPPLPRDRGVAAEVRSLERHAIDYRIAYTCDTSGGLRSAVASGLTIAPLSRSNIPSGARELTTADGFPSIDSSRVVLKRNPRRS